MPNPPSFATLLRNTTNAALFTEPASPMKNRVHLQPRSSKLAVVIGSNSSGKSLLRRQLQEECNNFDLETHDLSMELRSHEDAEYRGELYQSEEILSTGLISISSVLRTLSASKSEKRDHVIILDEPDVGLSDEVAAGLAVDILTYLEAPSKHLIGVLLITHRRAMLDCLNSNSTTLIYVGAKSDVPASLSVWNSRRIVPQKPREVIEAGVSLWTAMSEYQKPKEEK